MQRGMTGGGWVHTEPEAQSEALKAVFLGRPMSSWKVPRSSSAGLGSQHLHQMSTGVFSNIQNPPKTRCNGMNVGLGTCRPAQFPVSQVVSSPRLENLSEAHSYGQGRRVMEGSQEI